MKNITTSLLLTSDNKGLTTIEANDVLSRAERYASDLTRRIGEHHFIEETVEHISGRHLHTHKKGENENALHQVRAEVKALVNVKKLILRIETALALLEETRTSVNNTTLEEFSREKGETLEAKPKWEDYMEENGIKEPDFPKKATDELTEQDVICDLDVKTRARMLTLNATAAAIGNSIHPTGKFSEAREELMAAMNAPSELQPVGQVAVVTTISPTVGLDKVDGVFFELQARRREIEAEDNRIKTSITQKVRANTIKIIEENNAALATYEEELKNYSERKQRFYEECELPYLDHISDLNKQLDEWKKEQNEQLDNLKVAVPVEFVETLKDVNRLS